MDNQKLIGERIRKARGEAGLTQDELGEKVGYSGMGISYLEKGQRNITIDMLNKIVEALNINIHYLLEPIAGKAPINHSAFYGRINENEYSDEDKKKLHDFELIVEKEANKND